MTVIQGALFAAVLAYASVIDIRTRTVPNRIHALLLLTGLLTVSLSSVLWALTLFSVFFIVALATDIGGGDV
ncbi:MAG TPA: prepilin peptidase, partial [Ruminococcaceae bacterium]|nr:prepilin peptidase [Oscillospiraceae bacterium]